jgi:triacylglycerol lipase
MLDALGEFRVPLEATLLWLHAFTYPWPHAEPGKGKVLLLIPGFMAGDITLAPMANFFRMMGHRPVMSGVWSNSDCPRESIARLGERLENVSDRHDREVVVIGQSLGGVYARELGHRYPDRIERVITMGSPLGPVRGAANILVQAVARSVARVRGKAEGCLSEECSCGMSISNGTPIEVPTTAIYSRTDGVVDWKSCVDRSGSPMVENVEVMSSHVGMAVSAEVYKVIANRLVLRPDLSAANRNKPTP